MDEGTLMFRWEKLGRVFDPTEVKGFDWMKEFAQAPCTLLFDDRVRVYFSCRGKPDSLGRYVSRCAYVDLNRANLFEVVKVSPKPVLGLGELGTFDEFGTYPVSVVKDGADVVAFYGGWTRCETVPFDVAIGCAVSHDNGDTFGKLGKGPMLSYSYDEPFVLSGPKVRRFGDRWYLWYIAGRKWAAFDGRPEPIYKIRMAMSCDGRAWEKWHRDLIPDRLGDDEAQASPDVLAWNGRYHMFYCYRQGSDYRRNRDRSYRIGYAVSHDLVNWTRDDSKAGIDVSEKGWDSEMVAYPHVFELDDQLFLLYLGNEVGRHGFGLARLDGRLD